MQNLTRIVLLCSLLSACAADIKAYIPDVLENNTDVNADQLYLRGVFNWWEAEDKYRLQADGADYALQINLIADGQPYEFKLADELYRPFNNCGAQYQLSTVVVDQPFRLYCQEDSQNLRFLPNETATYEFRIDRQGYLTISKQ